MVRWGAITDIPPVRSSTSNMYSYAEDEGAEKVTTTISDSTAPTPTRPATKSFETSSSSSNAAAFSSESSIDLATLMSMSQKAPKSHKSHHNNNNYKATALSSNTRRSSDNSNSNSSMKRASASTTTTFSETSFYCLDTSDCYNDNHEEEKDLGTRGSLGEQQHLSSSLSSMILDHWDESWERDDSQEDLYLATSSSYFALGHVSSHMNNSDSDLQNDDDTKCHNHHHDSRQNDYSSAKVVPNEDEEGEKKDEKSRTELEDEEEQKTASRRSSSRAPSSSSVCLKRVLPSPHEPNLRGSSSSTAELLINTEEAMVSQKEDLDATPSALQGLAIVARANMVLQAVGSTSSTSFHKGQEDQEEIGCPIPTQLPVASNEKKNEEDSNADSTEVLKTTTSREDRHHHHHQQ
ncbi:hypothetical protein ACA910_011535 [Epithemia clementina (nom. ined.)]